MSLDATVSLATATPNLYARTASAAAAKGSPEARARAQATEFEQVFLASMFNQMFAGLDTSGPFHGGQAEETWRGMLVDGYAGELARSGGIGVADAVYRQLLEIQEGSAK